MGKFATRLITLLFVVLVTAPALPVRAAGPVLLGNPVTFPNCYDPTQANADFEAYGPTDVNAQAGNGDVTAGINDHGTITVFKYPNPSYYNQVKYFAETRDNKGRVIPQFPNEGSFAGIRYRTSTGVGFAWLRDWPTSQRYDSTDTPVPVTIHRSPAALGLVVTDFDLVNPAGLDALERQFWVDRLPGSPVTNAQLVYFENFNPVASKIRYLPIQDWCLSQGSDQLATYDPATGSIVHGWRGMDSSTGHSTSVALAFGWDGRDLEHQVGADGFDPAALPGGPPDGYRQASTAPYTLGGAVSAAGQATGTLTTRLVFDANNRARARMTIAAAPDVPGAISALGVARGLTFASQLAAVTADWHQWLSHTVLPRSSDSRVIEVAKRSLITLRLAIAADSGAIVASSDTQGPYGEDWIRDGSFLNEVLDINGLTAIVTRHNLFYVRVQTTTTNPSPLRPPGNWPMASYADGVDGAPVPWEIDETGLGIWTLWNHASYLDPAARSAYLTAVYPTITRAANWLTSCRDPSNGFQCSASEDDNYTPSQSLHGAETVYLGLQSAIAAAAAMHDTVAAAPWVTRLGELRHAIDGLYDPQARSYRESSTLPNGYNVDYGDGGWMLWPVAYRPYSDPAMIGEAAQVSASMQRSLAALRGQYEGKALIGLAYAWSTPTALQQRELLGTLSYMAADLTTNTGLFGESWTRTYGPRPTAVQDQPHVWEHSLFYLAAVRIAGTNPYSFDPVDYFAAHAAGPGMGGLPTTSSFPDVSSVGPAVVGGALGLGVVLALALARGRRRRGARG